MDDLKFLVGVLLFTMFVRDIVPDRRKRLIWDFLAFVSMVLAILKGLGVI